MFIVIIVIKHPNSLQISPPSFITFPESFLTHLMCVWCMHVSVQVHAPMCAHVSVRALPLPLSPPLLPSDGVSLPQPETPCFPPGWLVRKVLGSACLLPGLQTHTTVPGFFCGVWVRSLCMQSRHSYHRNISPAPSVNFFAFFYSLVSCLKEFFLPTF